MKNILQKIDKYCCILTQQYTIHGVTFPKNTVVFPDDSTIFLCYKFPNYHGNSKKVYLQVWFLHGNDMQMAEISDKITCVLFNAWEKAGRPLPVYKKSEMSMRDYENAMKHDRKKKSGSGGIRLRGNEIVPENQMRYKQVTEPAYWAYMGVDSFTGVSCKNSGNASVVASRIRSGHNY